MVYTVRGILQGRILEWVAIPFSRGSSQPRDRTQVSHIAGRFFTSWAIREALSRHKNHHFKQTPRKMLVPLVPEPCFVKWSERRLVISDCDLMDCTLPSSSVHGILQARILKWVAIPFSRESSRPRDQIQVSCIAGRFFTSWATREAQFTSLHMSNTSSLYIWILILYHMLFANISSYSVTVLF